MSTHPLDPTPNIALRLLRSIFLHISLKFGEFAFFGFGLIMVRLDIRLVSDPRDADAFAHLAAYGFGLVRGAHGGVGVGVVAAVFFTGVGWWWAGGF